MCTGDQQGNHTFVLGGVPEKDEPPIRMGRAMEANETIQAKSLVAANFHPDSRFGTKALVLCRNAQVMWTRRVGESQKVVFL